jgi:hypothetical protein
LVQSLDGSCSSSADSMEASNSGPARALTPGGAGGTSERSQLYRALSIPRDSRYIRVVDLLCDRPQPDAPLRGTLKLVDLADSPEFVALSYVVSGLLFSCSQFPRSAFRLKDSLLLVYV